MFFQKSRVLVRSFLQWNYFLTESSALQSFQFYEIRNNQVAIDSKFIYNWSMELLDFVLGWVRRIVFFLWFGHNGYIAHFIIGIIFGAFVSIFYYHKSNKKMKSIVSSFILVLLLAAMKEVVDPLIGRHKNFIDLLFTCLGGIIGSLAVFSEKLTQLMSPNRSKDK